MVLEPLVLRSIVYLLDLRQIWYMNSIYLSVHQISQQSSYAFVFYTGFCKLCEKKKRKISPWETKKKEHEEIKPNFEGLHFMNVKSNFA